jgi:hypothetical protein
MAEIQNWDKVLTREGYERLKKELDYLIRVKRPEIAEKIRRAPGVRRPFGKRRVPRGQGGAGPGGGPHCRA